MAAKRKLLPTPHRPPPQSSSSDEETSDEEERQQLAAKASPFIPGNSRMQAYSDSDSEDEPEQRKETGKKPAESSDEEESDEEEEKQAALKPEPVKKKLKSTPSSSQSNGKFSRIFRPEDELVLMQAVSDFHSKNNRVPTQKECESFFDSLKGKLNPAITANQLGRKMRTCKENYHARKKKGTEPSPSANPHAKAIHEISEKLWGESVKAPKKEKTPKKEGTLKKEKPSQDMSFDEASSEEEEDHETETVNGTINGDENVKDASEFPYLMDAIVELSKDKQSLFLYNKNSFELMSETMAREFEAHFKKLNSNHARLVADNSELECKLTKVLSKSVK